MVLDKNNKMKQDIMVSDKRNYLCKWMVIVMQQFSILINGKLVQIRRIHTLMHPVYLASLRAFQFLSVMFGRLILMVFDRTSKTLVTLLAFWVIYWTRLFQCRTMFKINDNEHRSSDNNIFINISVNLLNCTSQRS